MSIGRVSLSTAGSTQNSSLGLSAGGVDGTKTRIEARGRCNGRAPSRQKNQTVTVIDRSALLGRECSLMRDRPAHKTLAIEQGAYFEGKSRRSDDPLAGVERPELPPAA